MPSKCRNSEGRGRARRKYDRRRYLFAFASGTLLLGALTFYPQGFTAQDLNQTVPVSRFGEVGLEGWKEESFRGHTTYSVRTGQDGRGILRAQTHGEASGLFLQKEIDLTATPFLNWSWRVDNFYHDLDEKTKAGDDYPARVYVVVSGGLFFWKTRALNYVWSSGREEGASWPNAYTANARMIAVRTRLDGAGVWRQEKRNVREDFKLQFGQDITQASAVAVMTDADQSGQEATAWYADIFFSSQ